MDKLGLRSPKGRIAILAKKGDKSQLASRK
jgi:hypothetical protein